ncbi:MAG: hypothetical protein ACTSPW_13000 [Promethearchaeota archaeon]
MIARKNTVFKMKQFNKKSRIQKIKQLVDECLKFKWKENQQSVLIRILTPCAFCIDTKARGKNCSECLIDKKICDDNGQKGYIGHLLTKYGNVFLKDINSIEYNQIRNILINLKSQGFLSNEKQLLNF